MRLSLRIDSPSWRRAFPACADACCVPCSCNTRRYPLFRLPIPRLATEVFRAPWNPTEKGRPGGRPFSFSYGPCGPRHYLQLAGIAVLVGLRRTIVVGEGDLADVR